MTRHFRFDRTTWPAAARKLFQALEWHSIQAIENTVIIKQGFVRICHHRNRDYLVYSATHHFYLTYSFCSKSQYIYNNRTNQGSYIKIATIFQGVPRVTLASQGPPTRNIISQIVHKCTFPVYSNKALRLEPFASPTSLHFSVHLS